MQELSKEDRTVENGAVVLYKRPKSKQWQARIRRFKGSWVSVSTSETNFEKAKLVASDKFHRMIWLQENDEIDVTRKFSDVAKLTIKQLQAEIDSGTAKSVYRDYIKAINNYLIPCFGNIDVHKIDYKRLLELDEFRNKKIGHIANKSTVNTHNAALNRVFKTAVDSNFMLKIQVPQLHNKGAKTKSRPYFSKSEYNRLVRLLREWAKTGHQQKTKDIRILLRDYVLILANTGIRTGEEALSIKWKNIRRIKVNSMLEKDSAGDDALEISVTGKTGTRTLIARDVDSNVSKPLERIRKRFTDVCELSPSQLQKCDLPVFRLPNLKPVKHERLARNFHFMLKHYGLLEDSAENQRSLYSLRHTYATFAIMNGLDLATLAVQMGTSIAMLERHYSKLKPYMKHRTLGGYIEATKQPDNQLLEIIRKQSKQLEAQSKLIQSLSEKL